MAMITNILLLVLFQNCICTIYYVNPYLNKNGQGKSWSDAFDTFESALSSATKPDDEIWLVANHTYIPSTNKTTNCFQANKGIKIYGGFNGMETNINQRHVTNLPSILTGNINSSHVITYQSILTLDTVTIRHNPSANIHHDDYSMHNRAIDCFNGALISHDVTHKIELNLNNVIICNNTVTNDTLCSSNINTNVLISNSKLEYNKAIDGTTIYQMPLSNVTTFKFRDYESVLSCHTSTFNEEKVDERSVKQVLKSNGNIKEPKTVINNQYETKRKLTVQTNAKAPNIILFVIDDLEWTRTFEQSAPVGTNLIGKTIKYFQFPTPNIASFMNESVIFPRAYCASPKCTPSRYSTLTGRQSPRSQWAVEKTLSSCSGELGTNVSVQTTKLAYDDSIYNVPYVLQNDINPWYTGMVGKWHLMSTDDNGYNYGCNSLSKTANKTLYNMCTNIVKQQGFNFVDAFYHSNIATNKYYSHNPEWMVSQAQKFINTAIHIEHKPFFLYFASTLNHDPSISDALQSYTAQHSPKGILMDDNNPIDTSMMSRTDIWEKALSHGKTNALRNEKFASFYWMDDSFGALINYLKRNNLYDNTFIILSNDHGMEAKGLMYEQGSRIINIVRYPPLFGEVGHTLPDDFVVSNVDLAAVIFDITGVTKPNEYVLDGKSWINDVVNNINNKDSNSCCEYRYIDIQNSHSIVTSKWQYIYRSNPNNIESLKSGILPYPNIYDQEQLYNIKSDPNQIHNQINNVSLNNIIARFQMLMVQYISDMCPVQTCKTPTMLSTSVSESISEMGKLNATNYSETLNPSLQPTVVTTYEQQIEVETMGTLSGDIQFVKIADDDRDETNKIFIYLSVGLLFVCCVMTVVIVYRKYGKQYGKGYEEVEENRISHLTLDLEGNSSNIEKDATLKKYKQQHIGLPSNEMIFVG